MFPLAHSLPRYTLKLTDSFHIQNYYMCVHCRQMKATLGNALKTVGGLNVSMTGSEDQLLSNGRYMRGGKTGGWESNVDGLEEDDDNPESDYFEGNRLEGKFDKRLRKDEGDGLRRCTNCKGTGHDRRNCNKFVLDSRGKSMIQIVQHDISFI